MKTALALALLLLAATAADARWVVRYQWVQPEPRFVERPPTRADLRYQLCNLETPAQDFREADARAIRCALNQGDCKGLRCIARAVAVGAVAVTIALFLLTAYLIGHAMAAPAPQQIAACGPDAQRLCAEFIPDGTAVKACLVRHRDQLSQSCKEVFPK